MITFPKYNKISEDSLKELHQSIKKSLDEDDRTPEGQDKPYGVREFPDWKEHKDAIEAAMKERNIPFEPIDI